MVTNRALQAAKIRAVNALQRGLSELELTVYQQVTQGLAEGKSSPKKKEIHKIAFFELLWKKTNLKQGAVTDAQSVVTIYAQVENDFESLLSTYCEDQSLVQADIFSELKKDLFRKVIALRQAVGLQRYWLSTFTPSISLANFESYNIALSDRSVFVEERQQVLMRQLDELTQANAACLAFIQVFVQHIKDRGLGFSDANEAQFNGNYEGDLSILSTFLNALPHKNTLIPEMQYLDGQLQGLPQNRVDAQEKINHYLEVFKNLIRSLEAKDNLFDKTRTKYDALLTDWLRRQEELSRIIANLDTRVGDALCEKCAALTFDGIQPFARAVIDACVGMPNKWVWANVYKTIGKALQDMEKVSSAFMADYERNILSFRASKARVLAFNRWYGDVFLPSVSAYESNVKRLHVVMQEALSIFDVYCKTLQVYQNTNAQSLYLFFQQHWGKMGLGGLLGGSTAFSMCLFLFEQDLSISLAYAGVLFLTGTACGSVAGVVKERCCPPSRESQPLLSNTFPEKPTGRRVISSYPAPNYALNLFSPIEYRQRADVEANPVRNDRSLIN